MPAALTAGTDVLAAVPMIFRASIAASAAAVAISASVRASAMPESVIEFLRLDRPELASVVPVMAAASGGAAGAGVPIAPLLAIGSCDRLDDDWLTCPTGPNGSAGLIPVRRR